MAAVQNFNEPIPIKGAPAIKAPVFKGHTVRQIVHISVGGAGLRVKLSNLFGQGPITLSEVRVARSTGAGNTDVSTDRAVTFGNQTTVTMAAATETWSDPISFDAVANADLAVSFYVPEDAPLGVHHLFATQTAYVGTGNTVSAASLSAAETWWSHYWLAGIDVSSPETTKVVVAFGDSITDGFGSTLDASHRWPNYLDGRLQLDTSIGRTSVVNAGIGGNRWLHDGFGPNGSGRFERDVLRVSGATHAIVLLGINDIALSQSIPSEAVSSEQITASMDAATTKAKAAGVRVYLGTLLPFKGAGYYTEACEATRQSVNTWIRTSAKADGVIDFDKVVQDPADSLALLPAYDSGDHLHPNDAGYQSMANAVDLNLLR